MAGRTDSAVICTAGHAQAAGAAHHRHAGAAPGADDDGGEQVLTVEDTDDQINVLGGVPMAAHDRSAVCSRSVSMMQIQGMGQPAGRACAACAPLIGACESGGIKNQPTRRNAISTNPIRLPFTCRIFGASDSLLPPIRWMGESSSCYHSLGEDGRSGFV
jgi:hypothetical protein